VRTVGLSTDGHGRAALVACSDLTHAAEPGVHPLCPPAARLLPGRGVTGDGGCADGRGPTG